MESIEIKLRQAVHAFNKGNYQIFFDIIKPLAEEGGIPQDFQKAFKWYLLAAEQGEMMAQSNLGHLYANEQTGKLDYIQAHE
jgi:TPR repeat protein